MTLQGNKSLSDIGTYSKAEIDGMTEIKTIELIYDETEDKEYFPSDKMYILEQRKPFIIRTNYSKVYTIRMYTFSAYQGLIEQDDREEGYLYINIEMGYDAEAEQVLVHFNGCLITKSTREVFLLEH